MTGLFSKQLSQNKVTCLLCNHFCNLENNETGKCGVRKNISGKIVSLVKNLVAARGIDPVEKKPLFHVLPGSFSYSIATQGCNFSCSFCQNASLAQTPAIVGDIQGIKLSGEEIVEDAAKHRCSSISYTYSEPTVFFELMEETGLFARKKGLLNLMVSNGFMSPDAIDRAAGFIDAANIDLKSFNPGFYEKICGGKLKPVLKNLVAMKKKGIFIEVTTLLIGGYNDSEKEINQIAQFIKNNLGEETPWHVSRFHPTFKMNDIPQTPVSSIHRAIEAGDKTGLKYIYSGNIPGDDRESTYCPSCGNIIIERRGYYVIETDIKNGKCTSCGHTINGIFQ